MKLLLPEPFSIEHGDITLKGEFTELTPKQLKDIEKLTPKKELKQTAKLAKKIYSLQDKIETAKKLDKWDKVEKLTDQLDKVDAENDAVLEIIDGFDTELMYKKRLELSISSENFLDIMALSEYAPYSRILHTIQKDIKERNEGN